jgi:hypothetical protein
MIAVYQELSRAVLIWGFFGSEQIQFGESNKMPRISTNDRRAAIISEQGRMTTISGPNVCIQVLDHRITNRQKMVIQRTPYRRTAARSTLIDG